MNWPARIELTLAPPIGIIVLGLSLLAAALAGALHPQLRALAVFVVAFPLLWISLATALSYTTARALRMSSAVVPRRTRALSGFRLALTLALDKYAFPAIGVLTSARFSTSESVIDAGPWAEIPILTSGRAATTVWEVLPKRRGILSVGPFNAQIELPGSAIRATALFDRTFSVNVLPAVYHLHPFVDTLLAGRHVAVGRYQKLPSATEEYVGAREYRPGDSPKLIHRILSLRARDPSDFYVREFQDPSREDLSLVLDTATPLDGDAALHRYRLEKAICFVCALCRTFAARRLTVRFVVQRGSRDLAIFRLRPIDADLARLDAELAQLSLNGDRGTLGPVLRDEVRRHGSAVIFVSLRPRDQVEQQRLPMVTLTPEHVPVFTREVEWQ